MSISIQCPANQRKGPFPVARNSVVSLSVTTGGSASVIYTPQPAAPGEPWVTWPQGVCTTPTAEIDVAENNYLAQVICTAGEATFSISDPDPLNNLPYNNWKSQTQFPTISSGTANLVASNNGSSVVWTTNGGGGTLPAVSSSQVHFVLTSLNGTTYALSNPPGWVMPCTRDSTGIQNAITYAQANNYLGVLLEDRVTYDMGDDQVAIFMSTTGDTNGAVFAIKCPGECVWDCTGFTTPKAALLVRGGGARYKPHVVEGIAFIGHTSNTWGVELNCATGATVKRCGIMYQSTAAYIPANPGVFSVASTTRFAWFFNDLNGQWNEGVVLDDCWITGGVAAWFEQGIGSDSFRAIGLTRCVWDGTEVAPMLYISSGTERPYAAHLDITCNTVHGTPGRPVTIIQNNGGHAAFYGMIEVETGAAQPCKLGGGNNTYFTGVVHSDGLNVRAGQLVISPMATNSLAVVTGVISVVQEIAPFNPQPCMEVKGMADIYVRLYNGATYDCAYQISARRVTTGGLNGIVTVGEILFERDTPGYGTVSSGHLTFDIDSNGSLTIDNDNYPSSSVIAYIDGTQYGQSVDVTDRTDFQHVNNFNATRLSNSTCTITGNRTTSFAFQGNTMYAYNSTAAINFPIVSTATFALGSTTILMTTAILDASLFALGFNT